MRDKGPIKIICRIITLLDYIFIVCALFLESELIVESDIRIMEELSRDYMKIILICTIPLIFIMIISLVLKYKLENESKVNPYRIIDVVTRTISTIPITLVASYYLFNYMKLDVIPNIAIGIIIFIVLNTIMKFTLQETMSVSFITSDNL